MGTAYLSSNLSDHLISAIRRQMPTIQHHITRNINDLQKDLDSMGGTVDNTRGGMIHAVLTQARTFETCFKKALEGQRAGVLDVMDKCWMCVGCVDWFAVVYGAIAVHV